MQTGRPTAAAIQTALNDLPSIHPLSVSVSSTSSLYLITFPVEMGDVPLLTCISNSPNQPIVIEMTAGVASGARTAFAIDDQFTDYIDFINSNITQANLTAQIKNVFSIQCPPSIVDPKFSSSVVYVEDFESNCVFDETPITSQAFCGQCSSNGNILINSNTKSGHILCFAYRLMNTYVTSIALGIQINGDTSRTLWPQIEFAPQTDRNWHYLCLDIRTILISQSTISSSVSSLLITNAWLVHNIKKGIFIDTVSIRTALPLGYEDTKSYPMDQSANSTCVFPFDYHGKSYTACTLNSNNMPICFDSQNRIQQCQRSSIVGVRRLYPKHQLVYNTLQVTHSPMTTAIVISFRYYDCAQPSLFVSWPSGVRCH
jgi:hypothetical protein